MKEHTEATVIPFPGKLVPHLTESQMKTFLESKDEPSALFNLIQNILDGFGYACKRGPSTPEDGQASILVTIWEKP